MPVEDVVLDARHEPVERREVRYLPDPQLSQYWRQRSENEDEVSVRCPEVPSKHKKNDRPVLRVHVLRAPRCVARSDTWSKATRRR